MKPSTKRLVRQHRFEQLETRNLLAANFLETFDGYAAAGFKPGGGDGMLDSGVWSAAMGTTSVGFGGTSTSTGLAGGVATAPVTSNGIYAFDLDGDLGTSQDRLIGLQPTGSVFNSPTAGHLTLRVQNDTQAANRVSVSYDVLVRNDQARANELAFSYSTNGVDFTSVPAATYTSADIADTLGLFNAGTINALTNEGVSVAPGSYLYLRWSGADISGTGSRDEFGIDNVSVTLDAVPGVATTTSLSSIAPLAVDFGSEMTFAGTVVAASGTGTPSGTVQIRDGGPTGTLLASTSDITGVDANGAFSFSSSSVPAGTFSGVQAHFVPSIGFDPSSSAVFGSTLTVTSTAPTLDLNRGLTLNPGQKVVLDAAVLSASDPDAGQTLTYTITQLPASGVFAKNGVPLNVGDSFTQTDLELDLIGGTSGLGLLTLTSTGATPASDSLKFVLSDGFNPLPEATLAIEIVAPTAPISFMGTPYTQNFDDLLPVPIPGDRLTLPAAMVLPAGWAAAETGANANSSVRIANDGIITSGDTGLFGATDSNERALGAMASGSLVSVFGAALVNDSGTTLDNFTLKYTGEQWKDGRSAGAVLNTLSFSYAVGAASLTDGSFTSVAQLDFVAPTGGENPQVGTDVPLNGNDLANQVLVGGVDGFTVTGIVWAPGQTLWLRWSDFNDAGNDDALAIDNVVFSAAASTTPGLTVVESGGSTNVTEGGATDTIQLTLTGTPAADVTITLTPSNAQVDLGAGAGAPVVLTFTPANANASQTVTVTAIDDAVIEGNHAAIVSFATSSADGAFNGLTVPEVTVHITDNNFNTVRLNEIYVNPPGDDDSREYVELLSPGGVSVSMAGLWLLEIEGDGNGGIVDMAIDLSAYSTGTNGLALLGAGYGTAENPWGGEVDPQTALIDLLRSPQTMENGTITFLLVAGFSGSVGDDLDTNNDGSFNVTPWVALLDSVGWSDGGTGDLVYSTAALTQSTGTPDAATRFPGNHAANSAAAWYNGDIENVLGTGFDVNYAPGAASANLPAGARITPGGVNFGPAITTSLAIAAANADKPEGNSGTTAFTFTVTRAGETSGATSVDYAVTGTGASPADAADFAGGALPSGAITFTEGQATRTLTVQVAGDHDLEPDETFLVTLSNPSGGAAIATATATGTIRNDDFATMVVTGLTPMESGFHVDFNRTFDPLPLNLYDSSAGALGATDLVLVGATVGAVRGSVVVRSDNQQLTFIKTGGPLEPDSYTVTLRSAADGFKDSAGNLLDGDVDGVDGGDYTGTFDVAARPVDEVVVSVPDFARGFGQAVNLPTENSVGIPVTLSTGQNVTGVDFDLVFDPALLNVTEFVGTAAGSSSAYNLIAPGRMRVTISSADEFSSTPGPIELGRFVASVPETAPYASKQILWLEGVNVGDNEPATRNSRADHGLHIAAFAGDANASRTYSSADTTLVQRINVGQGTGFPAFQLADPLLIADVNRSNTLTSADATLIQRLIVGTLITQAPPIPSGVTPPAPGGPDPRLFIPTDLTAEPGTTITIPVMLEVTEPSGISVSGMDLAIMYDPAVMTVSGFQVGALLGSGFALTTNAANPGIIRATFSKDIGPSLDLGEMGVVFQFEATILPGASNGATRINLMTNSEGTFTAITDNNLDELALVPAPTNSDSDPVDGVLTIGSLGGSELSIAATDAVKAEGDAGSTPFTFTVTRSGSTSGETTVTFTVTGSGANPADGVDFAGGVLPSGAVVFTAGETAKTITIPIAGDTIVEPDEGFTVTLSNPSGGATIATANASGTILNDDVLIATKFWINEVLIDVPGADTGYEYIELRGTPNGVIPTGVYFLSIEGDSGTTQGQVDHIFNLGGMAFGSNGFLVLLQAGHPYTPDSNSSVVAATGTGWGTSFSSRTNDLENGSNSFLLISSSTPPVAGVDVDSEKNGTLDGSALNWTILDSIGILDGGTSDTTYGAVNFSNNGNGASAMGPVVNLATSNGGLGFTPDLLARNGDTTGNTAADWVASDVTGTQPIWSLDATRVVPVALTGQLNHLGATNVFTLETRLSIAAADAVKDEGNSGTSPFTFTVTRAGDTSGETSVEWAVTGSGGNPSNADDFGGVLPSGTVTFAAGETAKTIAVAVSGDTIVEPDEGFTVTLSNPSTPAIIVTATASGTIVNDDGITLSIAPDEAVKPEGNSGLTAFTFLVTRSGDTSGPTTVDFAVTGSGANATDANDFGGDFPSGTVTFSAGESSLIITIQVSGDTTVEPHEEFTVTLSNPSAPATITTAAAQGTILNDDVPAATGLFINEVFFNPPSTDAPREYVEIRGEPNYTIPVGVYLVGLEGDSGGNPGDVQTIFDLSGLTLGSNGLLVFLQANHPYAVDPAAVTVVGTTTGFGGTGRFSAQSNGTDIENASVTFLLIQSPTPPLVGNDVDTANNGTLDGVSTNWSILDGIAVLDGGTTDVAYTSVVFAVNAAGVVPIDAVVINTGATSNYVGRVGVSTGASAADWVGGDIVGAEPNYALSPTTTFPSSLAGARLNHIGAPNNYASAGLAIVESDGSTAVAEGGAGDSYTIALSSQPLANVVVTVTPDNQLDLGAGAGAAITLTFTTADWNVAQVVLVAAVDDTVIEGPHAGLIQHSIAAGSAADYLGLSLASSDLTVSITDNDALVPPTVTATPLTKVYDGLAFTLTATADDGPGGFDPDTDPTHFTFTFYAEPNLSGSVIPAPKDAGTYSVDIAYAGNANYSPVASTAFNFTITPKALTASGTAANKVYDGNTDAVVTIGLDGVVIGDTVGGSASGTFDTKRVGTGKTVTVGAVALVGADAANYTVGAAADATADITAKGLTASATAANKVYDGNTDAVVTIGLDGVVIGDTVGGSASGTFDTKNVGTGKTVTVGAVALVGADAGNYTVGAAADATADITAKALTASATAANKVYDGNTAAVVTINLTGLVLGDTVDGAATGAFDNKNVGIGKTVTVGAVTLVGADAGNYTVGAVADATADITAKGLTASATAANKVYDGNTDAVVTINLTGLVLGDTVDGAATGAFDNKNVGIGKTVTIGPVTLSGAAAGNYTVGSAGTTTADITALALTAAGMAADKVYDGNTAAVVTINLTGLVLGDTVDGVATGAFDNKNVGTGKTVTIGPVTLSGAAAGNYTVGLAGTTTASITAAPLTVVADAKSKTVGAADPPLTFVASGFIGSETAASALTGSLIRESGEAIGGYEILQGSLSPVAGNYDISYTGATFQIVDVSPSLSIAATDVVKAEGDSGTTPFTFTVTRAGDTSGTTTVNWAVTGSGSNPANAADFGGALPSGSVTFAAGQASQTITVLVSGDLVVEPDEGFTVTLSNATSPATIATAAATGTILNDDVSVSITAASADKAEGDSGTTSFTFTATRAGDTSGTTTVNWAVTGSGASPADAADFGGSLPSGAVTFTAGQTSQTITVLVSGDTVVEPDEGFTVTLSNPSSPATIATAAASGIIRNDDIPTVSQEVWRFDLNSSNPSATQATGTATPYTGVLPGDLWDATRGYGWLSAVSSFDRGALAGSAYSNLLRDGHWGSAPRDFRMRVEPGQSYDVTVTFGDASFTRDRLNVSVITGSGAGVSNVATAAGQFVHRSFTAAPDGQGDLMLRFSDGGGDPYWTVNGIEVRPVYDELVVSSPGGVLSADGKTVDQFTVAEGQYKPGAWYTLSTDKGRTATPDGDSRYAGVQVQAPSSGNFTFQVQRGTAAGTASVRVEEVNGASRGGVLQEYVFAAVRRFDFNGAGVDTQFDPPNDFWNVRGSDVYTAAAGHGWNAVVSEFQRGTAGISEPLLAALYRDGHSQSAPRTFQVAVDPNKSYDVRIHTGDSSFARNQLQMTVEGDVVEPLVATAANEFKTITVLNVTPSGDGVLDIQIANLGGDPYWVINGIEVAESTTNVPPGPGLPALPVPQPPSPSAAMRFDFNSGGSPTASGFTGVGTSNIYDSLQGYGWQTSAPTFARGIGDELLRDGHWGTDNTFLVNVNPGSYIVNVTVGDAGFARNFIQVDVNGVPQISNLATAAGQFVHAATGAVSPVGGQLAVRVRSTGGDPYFTINALEILAAPQANHNLTTSNGLTFTGTSTAPNGALVTVATSLGSIASPDADPLYAGVQVVVTGGSFSFTVTPPTGGGTATVGSEEVTGLGKGSASQNYAVPDVRRFDFNGSGNATQSGFTGVRGSSLYNANNGYGWTVAVPEFQRGTTGYNVAPANVPLYRDGHWGSAPRTFQVQVDPALDYDVRVYVGDHSFARNLIQVTVEGAAAQIVPSTAANGFVAVTIVGGKATDGILDITIANTGGDPYWVINGIDVWHSGVSDPGALNLLAGRWGSELVGQSLTQEAIDAVLPLARDYWVSTGLADWQLTQLYQTPIAIGDLSYRGALGVSKPEGIWLDASGAGLGWNVSLLTPNSQLPTSSYDLLTVLAHELGHVLGYDDLDPQHHPDHLMAGVLRPGANRIAMSAGDSGPTWTFGESSSPLSRDRADRIKPAAGGRGPQLPAAGGHGLLVDRVIDDLLRDDLRVRRDDWQRDETEEFEPLLASHSNEHHDETDEFFAQF